MEQRKISKHITYAEATKSWVAENYCKQNTPNGKELEAMQSVAERIFEPLREHFGCPIAVTSFFRQKTLNALVGGSSNSQHTKGEALDLDADIYGGLTNADIFHYIRSNLDFDQLIWEFGDDEKPAWVHVSYKKSGNRRQILRSRKNGYNTEYSPCTGLH